MTTAATLFSGGGGADIGLSAAGLDVLWGIEHDDDIASVARQNDLDLHTADVVEEETSDWPAPDVLHASPPCPNFSVAKTGAEETGEDVSLARATVRFIAGHEPILFTLENVWGYRKSQSWKLIREHLQRSGYDWNAWKLNAADYGVPQTRKRMIVAARRGGPRPKKPPATHAENPSSGGLFGGDLSEWVGWYEAVKDLIPDLPETELADWQKERLPDDMLDGDMISSNPKHGAKRGFALSEQLVDKSNPNRDERKMAARGTADPVVCVDTSGNPKRAAIMQRPNDDGRLRAVLVHGQQTNPAPSGKRKDRTIITKGDDEPTFSINATAYKGTGRAILIGNNANDTSGADIWQEKDEPAFTERVAGVNERAVVDRCVVQMTPRCLARFQSFPDWYELPDSKSLACRIIGNAVPPLAAKKWVEHWI